MERVSVEVWQQILLKVMETSNWPIFATSCTPYTFLAFTYLHLSQQRDQKPYLDYQTQRSCLRLVCRAWNEFVLFTSHRWLPLEDWSPMYELDPTTLIRTKGGVGPIEILSTAINSDEFLTPILSWASHVLKRPASQSPLWAYNLHIVVAPELKPGCNPLDLLVGATTTLDPECTTTTTNANTTLRSLSITALFGSNLSGTKHSTLLSQISRTFTGLRSLFLIRVKAPPQQTLALAQLEVLYVECYHPEWNKLQQLIETWDTPRLRHVHLGRFNTPLTDVIDHVLGRYAHQIESLVLSNVAFLPTSCLDLPSGFWTQFIALRLFGLDCNTLGRKEWSGWSVVPPPTHPCRYLLCDMWAATELELESLVEHEVYNIHRGWTWNDGVRLVAGDARLGQYYIVKNIRDGQSIADMEKTVGVLPEL